MKRFSIKALTLAIALVALFMILPNYVQAATIWVEAFIDGESYLEIRGNTAQWNHVDAAAPGTWTEVGPPWNNFPTIINSVPWIPEWPEGENPDDCGGDCRSNFFTGVSPALSTTLDQTVTISNSYKVRDSAWIEQSPNSGNDYTLIVGFNDGDGGADWYVIALDVPETEPVTGSRPYAYITNLDSANVSVIDTATDTIVATTPVVGGGPAGVAVNPAGTRVYVTNIGSGNVSVIDTATNIVVDTIAVESQPFGVAVNPTGTRVYVANAASNTVSVINTATNTVVDSVPVGSSPHGIVVNPAGTRVYVANFNTNNVSVINTATNTVVTTVPVGGWPYGIAVNPAGTRVYVTNFHFGSQSVSVIDTATDTVVATVPVGISPVGVAVNPTGTRVYVANMDSDNISVIDTATDTVVDTVTVGNGPHGIAVNPAGTRVYVADRYSNRVSVIATSINEVVETVDVGTGPIAFGLFIGSPPEETDSNSSSSFCFIATAAYGSYFEPNVKVLRDFRDNILLTNRAGKAFVKFYYRTSPPIAGYIAKHENLRTVTRWALTPLVYGIKHPGIAVITLIGLVMIPVVRRRRAKRAGKDL
ncbi:MAG: YncE family protein [Thermodesulfovibrionia bacterium]|nr:YncE family protein [Thermodesulfovibrionia bacterium]